MSCKLRTPLPCPSFSNLARYSTGASDAKPTLRVVAELRKRTDVSISKAREALTATQNDVGAALEWLQKDMEVNGAKKAAKVQDRATSEGVICVSVIAPGQAKGSSSIRAAMIELNCETDFVARNHLFDKLAADLAHTSAYFASTSKDAGHHTRFFSSLSMDRLMEAPLMSKEIGSVGGSTVESAIRDTIVKVGENIALTRVTTSVLDNAFERYPNQASMGCYRLGSYVHGQTGLLPSQGKIGSMVITRLQSPRLLDILQEDDFQHDLQKLERSLARQVVGLETRSVRPTGQDDGTALYSQPFMMFADSEGSTVAETLQRWAAQRGLIGLTPQDKGVDVLDFKKWTVGEVVSE